jgi:cation:H+ antiporter
LLITLVLLLAAAVVIYLASELFVNGVEWVGHRLSVGERATGALLAAFGAALPECVVTFAAVVFGRTPAARELGVGAALGGPLALATVAYGMVGLTLIVTRRPVAATPAERLGFASLRRDQVWFLAIFLVKLALGVMVFAWKPWLGGVFVVAYAAYVWKEIRGGGGEGALDLEPLRFAPRTADPSLSLALIQTLAALAVIYLASRFFVSRLEVLGPRLGLHPQLLALLLSPIATELPETLNAVIWIRKGKTPLALANISGAMMIQATIPTALGLVFTPWRLDRSSLIAGAVTAAAMAILAVAFGSGRVSRSLLAAMAAGYGLFLLLIGIPGSRG